MKVRQIHLRESIISNPILPTMNRDEIIETLGQIIVDISNGNIRHLNWREVEP